MIWRWSCTILVSLAVLVATTVLRGIHPFHEYAPAYSNEHLLGTLAIVGATAILVGIALRAEREAFANLGLRGIVSIVPAAAIGVIAAFVAAVDPVTFNAIVVEDGLAENGSAILLFLGSLTLLTSLFLPASQHSEIRWMHLAARVFLALLLSVIALEEVSWFQRPLGIETPEWLAEDNMQGELNFHNLDTNLSENLYYAGVTALLIGGRLLFAVQLPGQLQSFVSHYRPGVTAFAFGTVATAFNYEMWNQLQIQFGFFLAVLITACTACVSLRAGRPLTALALLALLVALPLTQALLLLNGHQFVRLWDATEMRELLMAGGLFCYCAQLALSGRSALVSPAQGRLNPEGS